MDADIIRNTVITTFDKEDQVFVLQSPLCEAIMATGETKTAAWEMFEDMLTEHMIDYHAGRLANPVMGRPRKGKTRLNAEIAPDIKDNLIQLSKEKKLSQGEVIEYLYAFWKRKGA